MKTWFAIILTLLTAAPVYSGPPEPVVPPTPPEAPAFSPGIRASIDSLKALNQEFRKGLENLRPDLQSLSKMLEGLGDSLTINEITIEGDSIVLKLKNDSLVVIPNITNLPPRAPGQSMVYVGRTYVVDEGQTVNGNIVDVGGDVIVKGTVNGSVWTVGSDIYVTSTGYVQDGAIAFSGKVKQEPGGQIGNIRLALNESGHGPRGPINSTYRLMALIFLVLYFMWLVLSATCASLFKANVSKVLESMQSAPWKSFLLGYLAYLLAFAALTALVITILGALPGVLGVPLLLFAGMVMSSTALQVLIGQRIIGDETISVKTFLYGALVLSSLPGIMFLAQYVTGSLVIMVLNWVLIATFLFVIIPFGLGAVLTTRFGTRSGKGAPGTPPAVAPQPTN